MPTILHLKPSLLTCQPQPRILVFPWILSPPSRSTGREQPSPTPGSQFSPDQLSQLRELIAETVGSKHSGPGEAPRLLADVPLLSPASPLNVAAITTMEQNLNGVNLPNVIQDGSLSLSQFVPSLPQASQGPGQQIVPNEHEPTLPPPLEKLRLKISKCCLTLHLKASKTDPYWQGCSLLFAPSHRSVSAVRALRKYLALRPTSRTSPLYVFQSGNYLIRAKVTTIIRTLLQRLGISSELYASHCYRIGATTSAAEAGLPPWLIQTLGRWSSNCYTLYIRTPPSVLQKVPGLLAATNTSGQGMWNPLLQRFTPGLPSLCSIICRQYLGCILGAHLLLLPQRSRPGGAPTPP